MGNGANAQQRKFDILNLYLQNNGDNMKKTAVSKETATMGELEINYIRYAGAFYWDLEHQV